MSVWRKNFVSVFCVLQFSYYIFNEVCGIEIKTSEYFNFSQTLCVDDSDNESNDGLVEEIMVVRSEKHYYKRRFSIERETKCVFFGAPRAPSHTSRLFQVSNEMLSQYFWSLGSLRHQKEARNILNHGLIHAAHEHYFRLIFYNRILHKVEIRLNTSRIFKVSLLEIHQFYWFFIFLILLF